MSTKRGILGLKKDPKKQILFSFRVRDGEEWTSDSEDSDYMPDGTEEDETISAASGSTVISKRASVEKRRRNPSERKAAKQAAANEHKTSSRPHNEGIDLGVKRRKLQTSSRGSRQKHAQRTAKAASPSRASESGASSVCDSSEAATCSVPQLPLEIWGKIFEFYVRQFGSLPFLCRASRVCKDWYNLASSPSLWRSVDLAFGWIKSKDETLMWLARNRLSQCREISLAGWKNVTDKAVQVLSDQCPQLRAVNLSHCKKLTSATVSALVCAHPDLQEIDLSFASADTVSTLSLKLVAEKLGKSLTSFVLSGNVFKGFNLVLNAVMDRCSHLETLDLSNCRFSTDFFILNVEKLQASCPNLRVLRITNCKIRASSISDAAREKSSGFPKLHELSCAMPATDAPALSSGVPDDLLARLLHKAEHLQLLDLRGCTNFHLSTLLTSAAGNLEHLYLSQTAIGRDGNVLHNVIFKWRHSLKTLDLAWTQPSESDMERAVRVLVNYPSCPTMHLDFSGSSAATPSVVRLALMLSKLELLDLTSCRSLPRGIKCPHKGRKALVILGKKMECEASGSDTDSY